MKARSSILVIWLAAVAANIGWAQPAPPTKVTDRARKEWTCRVNGNIGSIYWKLSQKEHVYDIAVAKGPGGEPHDPNDPNHPHDPICIDASAFHNITWWWLGAQNIEATFISLTDDRKTGDGRCWKSKEQNHPFTGGPSSSGILPFLASGDANDYYSGCAYDVTFKSSAGTYDPHIIIKGSYTATLPELKEKVKDLEGQVKKLKAEIKNRDKKK
jgi:hypothetical protein